MTKTYDSGAARWLCAARLRPITNPKGVYQMSLLDEIKATIASYREDLLDERDVCICIVRLLWRYFFPVEFIEFARMINWSSDTAVGLVAVSHPKFKPWTRWTLLPYSLYIRLWALRVCWLNAKQSHMYAWDYFLMMNYWEYQLHK